MSDLWYEKQRAEAIAVIAHRGQVDKGGEPYIEHPRRVAASFNGKSDCLRRQIVAFLHDVLEDSDLTEEDLQEAGISGGHIADIRLLTRVRGEPSEKYYARVRESSIAREVKLADIADNTDPERLAKLDDETVARLIRKYAKAKAWMEFRESE